MLNLASAHFWPTLQALMVRSQLVIDRPQGSQHPRYPDLIYPLNYGYLADTTASDGDGIDVWVGSAEPKLAGIVVTVDVHKRDTEIKIVWGCTAAEIETVLAFHNNGDQAALWVAAPA